MQQTISAWLQRNPNKTHASSWSALFYGIPESCGVPNHPALPPYSSQHIKTIQPFLQNTWKSNSCCLEGTTLWITQIIHPKSIPAPASQVSQNPTLVFTDVVQSTRHSYYSRYWSVASNLCTCHPPSSFPTAPFSSCSCIRCLNTYFPQCKYPVKGSINNVFKEESQYPRQRRGMVML